MNVPAESLSGSSVRDKVVTAAEAVRLIRDGDSVVVEGFVGQCFAEELTLALEQRFLQTGAPRDLTLVFTVAQGDRQGRGLDRLCSRGPAQAGCGRSLGLVTRAGEDGRGQQDRGAQPAAGRHLAAVPGHRRRASPAC